MRILLVLLSLPLALPAAAQDSPSPFAAILAEAKKIHGEDGLRNGSLGFALIPVAASDSSALVGYREDTALIPASTMKAVTTATAAELLGHAFRFTTTLEYVGKITDDGTLKGDVVIRGGGDPTLAKSEISKTFSPWRTALEEAGIKKIDGRVVGDGSLFGTQLRPDSWQWNDLGNYYAAGACGLTIHENQFYCRFKTGKQGTPAPLLGTDPRLAGVKIVNEMKVGPPGSGDQGYIYGAPYSTLLYLRGTVPPGGAQFTIRGALPDPAYFCARSFSLHLEKHGVDVSGEPTTARRLAIGGKSVGTGASFFEQKSDALPALLRVTNHRSHNLYAECLHRMIGVRQRESGTTRAAAAAVAAHWKSKGIDLTGFTMADGCGLSRVNAITARQLTLMLYHAARSAEFDHFYKSLPVAGRSGTLRHIGRGTGAEGRVRAKSGSIERVKTYCGYVNAKSGKRYAFALLINNYTGSVPAIKAKIVRVWNKIAAL